MKERYNNLLAIGNVFKIMGEVISGDNLSLIGFYWWNNDLNHTNKSNSKKEMVGGCFLLLVISEQNPRKPSGIVNGKDL